MLTAEVLLLAHAHLRLSAEPQVCKVHGQEPVPHQAPHPPLRRLERISQVPSEHAFYCQARLPMLYRAVE